MSEPDRLVHRAAEAVADGVAIDWDAASHLGSPNEKALLANLRDIRMFAQQPKYTNKATAASAGTQNSALVSLTVVAAALQVAVAIVGFLAGPRDNSQIPAAWPLLLLSVFATVGLGLIIGGRQDRRAVLLGTFYLVAATSFAHRFIGWFTGAPRPIWANLFLETLSPYLLWRFVQAFPRVERFSRADRHAALAVPLSLGAGCILIAVNLALPLSTSGTMAVLAPLSRWRPSSNYYWAIISTLTIGALVAAPFRARSAAPSERRRVGWFLLCIGFGAAPLLLELLLEAFFPAVAETFTTAMLAAITYPFLASIPVTTAYAVMVERVVEVSFVIRRTLQYALARIAILALTIVPLVAFVWLGFQYRNVTVGQLIALPIGRGLIATAVLGILLLLSRDPLLVLIDRAFRRKTAAVDGAIAAVTSQIRDAADVRELSDRVEPILAEMFGASASGVLALDRDATAFEASHRDWDPLATDSAIVALIGDDDEAIEFGRDDRCGLFEVLPNTDKEWLERTSCAVITPLRGRASDLLGVLALRSKDDGLRFSNAELAALRGVSGPIALVLDQIIQTRRRAADESARDDAAAECTACGVVLSAMAQTCECGGTVRTAAVPSVIAGKFRVERRLGAGAMGAAYLARDLALQRQVVIKALPRRLAGATRQLEGEARAMARVSDRRIALIFGVETWRGAPLLVMEYLAGGTLADRIRRAPLPWRDALEIGRTLAGGLQVLHDEGVLHRDVKPSNIAFTADGAPKLLDFGLARLLDDAEDSNRLAGTPLYLAPELTTGVAPGRTSDLWSLSLVLYEAIAARNPFTSDTVDSALRLVAAASVPDLRTIHPDIPPSVAHLFKELLARNASQRPTTAAELIERLTGVLARVR